MLADTPGHNLDSIVRPGGQVVRERRDYPANPLAEVQGAISDRTVLMFGNHLRRACQSLPGRLARR